MAQDTLKSSSIPLVYSKDGLPGSKVPESSVLLPVIVHGGLCTTDIVDTISVRRRNHFRVRRRACSNGEAIQSEIRVVNMQFTADYCPGEGEACSSEASVPRAMASGTEAVCATRCSFDEDGDLSSIEEFGSRVRLQFMRMMVLVASLQVRVFQNPLIVRLLFALNQNFIVEIGWIWKVIYCLNMGLLMKWKLLSGLNPV